HAIVLTAQAFIVSAAASGPVPVSRLLAELGEMLNAYLAPAPRAAEPVVAVVPGGSGGPAAGDGGCAHGRTVNDTTPDA
ncbi:MAG: hypothetical protein ACRDSS_12420, partial [Actinocrinis sp.]